MGILSRKPSYCDRCAQRHLVVVIINLADLFLYENCLYMLTTMLIEVNFLIYKETALLLSTQSFCFGWTGFWFPQRCLPFFLIVSGWLLSATVLVNRTQAFDLVHFVPAVWAWNHLLANNQQLSIIVLVNTVLSKMIIVWSHLSIALRLSKQTKKILKKMAKSGAYKTLGDQVRRQPENLIPSINGISNLMNTKRYAFPYVWNCHLLISQSCISSSTFLVDSLNRSSFFWLATISRKVERAISWHRSNCSSLTTPRLPFKGIAVSTI